MHTKNYELSPLKLGSNIYTVGALPAGQYTVGPTEVDITLIRLKIRNKLLKIF